MCSSCRPYLSDGGNGEEGGCEPPSLQWMRTSSRKCVHGRVREASTGKQDLKRTGTEHEAG